MLEVAVVSGKGLRLVPALLHDMFPLSSHSWRRCTEGSVWSTHAAAGTLYTLGLLQVLTVSQSNVKQDSSLCSFCNGADRRVEWAFLCIKDVLDPHVVYIL